MAADWREESGQFVRTANLLTENHWDQTLAKHHPGDIDRLRVEEGPFHSRAFSPAGYAPRKRLHQENPPVLDRAETGFKGRPQTHADFAKVYARSEERRVG